MAAVLDTALLQALLLTGQAAAALDLLKGLNYCDVKICEEILRNGNHYLCLLELYKCNSMHRDALKLLHQLVEESKSDDPKLELTQKFKPKMIIEYLKPLCGIDPMLVLEFSMLVLESCPTQTIDLFLSGNMSADLVNSYLKQHAPSMQGTYLELMLSMNENGISGNLQNEMATNHQPSDLLVIIFSIVRNTFLDYSIYRFNLSEGWIPDLRWIRVQCKLHFSKTSAYYRGAMGFLLDRSMVTNTSDFCRGWFSYVLALLFAFLALFIVVTRYCIRGGPADEFKVIAPPPMNTMEQLLAVQNAISQAEELIQDGNVVLLKLCGLLLSIFPQASDHFAVALLITAVFVAFVPRRYVVLFVFLEEFTKYSPMRRSSTERWSRRLRQWWFSIPAAPVVLEKIKEDKKKK